ncbi:hypothetical protein Emag_007802 [Eimeria magna]
MLGFKISGLSLVPLSAFFLLSLTDPASAVGGTSSGSGIFSTFKPKRNGSGMGRSSGFSGGSGGVANVTYMPSQMQQQPLISNTGKGSFTETIVDVQVTTPLVTNAPSNGDLLMQYLSKKSNQPGKTAQAFIEKLVSKTGGIVDQPAVVTAPMGRSITVPEADPELVEVVTQESCNQVPSLSAFDCVQKELQQTPYTCSLNHFPEVCEVVTQAMETMCPQVVQRTLTYECPQLRNQQLCYSVPKTVQTTCTGLANQVQQSDCERMRTQKVCSTVEVDVPWTCLETEDLVQEYTCDKIESVTECLPNVVAIDDDCTREVNVPVVYEYYDVETTTQCETVQVPNPACLQMARAAIPLSSEPCMESYFDTQCRMVDVMVETLCQVTNTVIEEYACEQTEMRTFKKACGFGQGKKFFMLEQQTNGNANANANGSSLGRGCSYEAPVTVTGTCTREVQVTNQEPCTESQQQEQCEVVEKQYEVTCPDVQPAAARSMQESCPEFINEEVCTQINNPITKTGVRYEKRSESYPCTSTSAKEVCVQLQVLGSDTCSVQLQQTKEATCTRRRKKQVCQDKPVPSIEVCAEISEQQMQYQCDQITYEEKCSTVPYYEMGQCEMTLTETVLEPCQSNFQVTECVAQTEPQMGTCFSDEEVEVPQTCFKVEYNTTCNTVQTTRLMENALASKAAGNLNLR